MLKYAQVALATLAAMNHAHGGGTAKDNALNHVGASTATGMDGEFPAIESLESDTTSTSTSTSMTGGSSSMSSSMTAGASINLAEDDEDVSSVNAATGTGTGAAEDNPIDALLDGTGATGVAAPVVPKFILKQEFSLEGMTLAEANEKHEELSIGIASSLGNDVDLSDVTILSITEARSDSTTAAYPATNPAANPAANLSLLEERAASIRLDVKYNVKVESPYMEKEMIDTMNSGAKFVQTLTSALQSSMHQDNIGVPNVKAPTAESPDGDVLDVPPPPPPPPPPSLPFPTNAWSSEFNTAAPKNSSSCTAESCITCTAASGCGWMTDAGTCDRGTSEGPSDFNATSNQMENFWQYGSCADAVCNDYPSCNQCMADSLCGWCASSGKCSTDRGAEHQQDPSPVGGEEEEFCPAGWCAHPQGLHPLFHRSSTHSKNIEIQERCESCRQEMESNLPPLPVEVVKQEAAEEQNRTAQVEALDRVVGDIDVVPEVVEDTTEEKDLSIVSDHADALVTDWKIADKLAEEACSTMRRLQGLLEDEENNELHAEENGGGEDLIASALGETSKNDALSSRVLKAREQCTELKRRSIMLQEMAEKKRRQNVTVVETEEEEEIYTSNFRKGANLTLGQKIQIQEQKAQAAVLATRKEECQKELSRSSRNLQECKENDQGSGCATEEEKNSVARAELAKVAASIKQHEMLARQAELDFGGGTMEEKKLVAADVDIANKQIHLANVEQSVATGEMTKEERERAIAELKESEQRKAVGVLESEVASETDPDMLRRMREKLDQAKDLLEENMDRAASLSGEELRRSKARSIATAKLKEDGGILGSKEGMRLASIVERCLSNLRSAVSSKTPNPERIIQLCAKCQPDVALLNNLTSSAMSPSAIAASYLKHQSFESEALICLEEGRTVEECSKSNVTGVALASEDDVVTNITVVTGNATSPFLNGRNATAVSSSSESSSESECCEELDDAACLSCQLSQTVEEYCLENDQIDAPIKGCKRSDQVSASGLNVAYDRPGMDNFVKKAEMEAESMLSGGEGGREEGEEEEEEEEKKETKEELAERTLSVVVQLGGMSCGDVVSPKTELSLSGTFGAVLQMDAADIKTTALCGAPKPDNAVVIAAAGDGGDALPVEERALELHLELRCVSSGARALKKQLLQTLNGPALSTVTETIVSGLVKSEVCPKDHGSGSSGGAAASDSDIKNTEEKERKKELTLGGCANVVAESLTPKQPGMEDGVEFETAFGYTMGDLMRMVGTKATVRMMGPPGAEINGPGFLSQEEQRLSFVRSFLDEYNLKMMLKDEENWEKKVKLGFEEKLHETEKKYTAALNIYKSAKEYKNPVKNLEREAINGEGGTNINNSSEKSKFVQEMERVEKKEKEKEKEAGDALKGLTTIMAKLEPMAANMSEPFHWPSEHAIVESWLGIVTNKTLNSTVDVTSPSMEEMVKFEEREAAKKAREAFLEQRKRIWEQRMQDMKRAAAEENAKAKEAGELHDRRIRIATEKIEEKKKSDELEKKKRNDLKNSRLEEEYTKIENQTDSMDARDYMKMAKETAKLKARANALHEMDTHFEEGVDKLKKVEGGQLNITNEEKEQLAEEVQDDMMKLDVEVRKLLSVLSSVLFCFYLLFSHLLLWLCCSQLLLLLSFFSLFFFLQFSFLFSFSHSALVPPRKPHKRRCNRQQKSLRKLKQCRRNKKMRTKTPWRRQLKPLRAIKKKWMLDQT